MRNILCSSAQYDKTVKLRWFIRLYYNAEEFRLNDNWTDIFVLNPSRKLNIFFFFRFRALFYFYDLWRFFFSSIFLSVYDFFTENLAPTDKNACAYYFAYSIGSVQALDRVFFRYFPRSFLGRCRKPGNIYSVKWFRFRSNQFDSCKNDELHFRYQFSAILLLEYRSVLTYR